MNIDDTEEKVKEKEKEIIKDNKNTNEQSQNFLNKKRIKYKVILNYIINNMSIYREKRNRKKKKNWM